MWFVLSWTFGSVVEQAPSSKIPSADQGTSDPAPERKTAWGLNCREVAIQTFQLAIQTPANSRLLTSKKT